MKYMVTASVVQVIGTIWQPGVGICAMEYSLSAYDVENIEIAKGDLVSLPSENDWKLAVESWLSANAGNFQSIEDFTADLETSEGNIVIEWSNEESELTYNDCMYGEED